MRKAFGAMAGAVLAAATWATPARALDPRIQAEKTQAAARGPLVTAGVVAENRGDQIVVNPYAGGQPVTVSVAGAPVFQGTGKITAKGLMKNVNVRIHHTQGGGIAQATSIEVLTPEEAKAERANPTSTTAQNTPVPAPTSQPTWGQPQPTAQPAPQQQPTWGHPAPIPAPTAQNVPQQPAQQPGMSPQQAFSQADGNQAGTIKSLQGNSLILDPYETKAGDATLTISSTAPVFQGNTQVPMGTLRPGQDVRIDYSKAGGGRPSVVAVELLDAQQASMMRQRDNPAASSGTSGQSAMNGPSQPGKVKSVKDGYLTIDPYQKAAGNARLRIDPNVEVRRGSFRDIRPGADVRVFYSGDKVVAVELLDKGEAKRVRQMEKKIPRGM